MKTIRNLLIALCLLALPSGAFAANGLTTYGQTQVSNALLQHAALGAPATWYLALFTAVPTVSGGGTEASYTSYARLAIPASSTYWSNPTAVGAVVTSVNNLIEQFTAAGSGASATIVGWALYDASTVGNMWFFGTTSSTSVSSGIIVQFSAGEISLIWTSVTP